MRTFDSHRTDAQRHTSLSVEGATRAAGVPLLCTQRAGDVLIVPTLWGHATRNLAPSIGYATEVAFDRSFDLGLDPTHGDEWWRDRPHPPEGEAVGATPRAMSTVVTAQGQVAEPQRIDVDLSGSALPP